MKAVVTSAYGSVNVLNVEEVEKPQIGDEDILVRVRACSVNPIDWKIREGHLKIITGKLPPKILGGDFSGTVEDFGNKVTGFSKGLEVWGHISAAKGGAYAEYIKVTAENITPKPKNFDFVQSASIPLAGLTAYQALVDHGKIKAGLDVLINGCTGGVGSAAVQIAKTLGCNVTGVCSTKNIAFATRIGVDEIVDYKQTDVLNSGKTFDGIFDFVGNLSFPKTESILKDKGIFVTANPSLPSLILGTVFNNFRSKKSKSVLVKSSKSNLEYLKNMAESGTLETTVEAVYPLSQVREAHTHSASGRVVGKVVMSVD